MGMMVLVWNPPDGPVCLFVTWAGSRIRPESIRTYICGIRDAHLAQGLGDPTQGVMTRRALKELMARHSRPTKLRLSITTPVLRAVLKLSLIHI